MYHNRAYSLVELLVIFKFIGLAGLTDAVARYSLNLDRTHVDADKNMFELGKDLIRYKAK